MFNDKGEIKDILQAGHEMLEGLEHGAEIYGVEAATYNGTGDFDRRAAFDISSAWI